MKTKFTLFTLSLFLLSLSAAAQSAHLAPPGNVSDDWYAEAFSCIDQMEYDFHPEGQNFRMVNTANGLGFLVIEANVTGGAAYAYLGQSDGTYLTTPSWSMFAEVTPLLGINATSLLGFSVAGGIHSNGPSGHNRAVVGGPSNSLDFGSGLLNLGNTLGTLMSFTFDNNGLGKAYSFETDLCLITLPVDLKDFTGVIVDKTVKLNWTSVDEININMYQLQRSADGKNFEPLAIVFSQNGVNNSYNYPDMNPLPGINYYRLKIIGNDNKSEYSKIVSFRFDSKSFGAMIVAPNPAREVIRVRLSGIT
ncbi:MAG: hypothetical protein ABIR18_04850, partial [Chitinophagaceae bacterium]